MAWLRSPSPRGTLLACAFAAGVSFSSSPAHGSESSIWDLVIAGSVFSVAAPIIVHGSADIYYAGKRSWAPRAWAASEIGSSALLFSMGAIVASVDDPQFKRSSLICFIPATIFMTHGFLSLANYKPPVEPAIIPVEGGAMLQFSGRF